MSISSAILFNIDYQIDELATIISKAIAMDLQQRMAVKNAYHAQNIDYFIDFYNHHEYTNDRDILFENYKFIFEVEASRRLVDEDANQIACYNLIAKIIAQLEQNPTFKFILVEDLQQLITYDEFLMKTENTH